MKEQKRLENREESHCWLANVFFCFYFPFICKFRPVNNDDVYDNHTDDKCEKSVIRAQQYLYQRMDEYEKAKNKWEEKKIENPGKKFKEPQKPPLLWMLIFGVGTWKLIIGQILLFISTGLAVVQPLLMGLLLKAVKNKQNDLQANFPYVPGILIISFQV
ncbi:MAG: hypothetical protein EZS28_039374 [Streblomastix strix]|uniref:Uncharacterized protein n=1 Tax=Streblomastix strix TaxID=222440 RepID=A0A5J4U417_9EUKA|nr:MAG: hypothetical protein EZS28_039374 [Streblomastix strix]